MNDKEKKAFVARMKKGKKDAAKNKKKKAYAYKRKYLSSWTPYGAIKTRKKTRKK